MEIDLASGTEKLYTISAKRAEEQSRMLRDHEKRKKEKINKYGVS